LTAEDSEAERPGLSVFREHRAASFGAAPPPFPAPRLADGPAAMAEGETSAGGDDVPPLPRHIQIEVTGACNLRCRMCLVSYRPALDRTTASMSLERFRRLLDELPELEEVTLQGLGEPLLAPDFFAMVEAATNRGIRVGFNTNGTLLTRDRAERLVRLGVSWLHVSVDAAEEETFAAIRVGAKLPRVLRNLRGLVDVKRQLAATSPRIQLNVVAMRTNLDQLPELVRQAGDIGVDRIWVQRLAHDFSDASPDFDRIRAFTDREQLSDSDDLEATFDRCRAVAERFGIPLRLPERRARRADPPPPGVRRCAWPFTSAYVAHDGRVQPCCMVMGAERATLGSLETSSFEDIWGDRAYRDFRAGLVGRTDPPAVCRGCSVYHGHF
jgi:radical SAM protein with 4Fe4S-binding SPASM domain